MEEKKEIYIETEKHTFWNFKNYFKSIKRFKWWVLGSTLLCSVLGFLSFKFILNPELTTLTATFSYNLAATKEGNDSYRFIDGTVFNFTDIISKDNLMAVKNADPEKYASVDVDKLFSNNSIKLQKIQPDINESVSYEDLTFSISAKLKAFKDDEIGKDFLYAVLSYPKEISTKAINNYFTTYYLGNIKSTDPFEKQINLFKSQYASIQSTYQSLISAFGESVIVGDTNSKLYELNNLFTAKYNNGTINEINVLLDKMYSNYYLNYEVGKEAEKIQEINSLVDSYIESVKSTKQQKAVYEARVNDLVQANLINDITDSNFVSELLEYNRVILRSEETIKQLKKQLKLYGKVENEEGNFVDDTSAPINIIHELETKGADWIAKNAQFKKEISAIFDSLSADSVTVTNAYKSLYSNYKNKVILHEYGFVTAEHSLPSFLGAGAGLLLGYLISSLIVAAIYIEKFEKNKAE